jgi:putative nucleotidyltransferase with HDIG domain
MTRILFTDDEPRILDGLRRMLRGQRREWDMVFALEGHAAVAELEAGPFDVVVSDMRMPRLDGVEVLTRAQHLHPEAIRIVLSGHTDRTDAARASRVAHQFIMKPSSPDIVRGVMGRVSALRAEIPERLRRAVGSLGSIPVTVRSHEALLEVLQRTDLTPEPLVGIIAGEPGMSAKILQAVNSSFFGGSRETSDVASAVRLLGPALIREMVLSGEVFRPFRADAGSRFSMEVFRAHSLAVATTAAGGAGVGSVLYSAGLLHDIGKLILAETMPEAYEEVLETAAGGTPLHEVERERLGATHAQIGAYLLSLWSLPASIVAAVARHHETAGADEEAEVLAAIRRAHEGDDAPFAEPSGLASVPNEPAGS